MAGEGATSGACTGALTPGPALPECGWSAPGTGGSGPGGGGGGGGGALLDFDGAGVGLGGGVDELEGGGAGVVGALEVVDGGAVLGVAEPVVEEPVGLAEADVVESVGSGRVGVDVVGSGAGDRDASVTNAAATARARAGGGLTNRAV